MPYGPADPDACKTVVVQATCHSLVARRPSCGSGVWQSALGPSPGTNSAPTSRPEWMLVQKEYASKYRYRSPWPSRGRSPEPRRPRGRHRARETLWLLCKVTGPRRGPRYSRSVFVICALAQLLAAACKSRRARSLNSSGPGAVDISCENFGWTRRSTRRFLRRNLSPQLRDALVLDGLPSQWCSTQALEQRSIFGQFATAITSWFFSPSVGRRGSAR